jgi:hypothetical protein
MDEQTWAMNMRSRVHGYQMVYINRKLDVAPTQLLIEEIEQMQQTSSFAFESIILQELRYLYFRMNAMAQGHAGDAAVTTSSVLVILSLLHNFKTSKRPVETLLEIICM